MSDVGAHAAICCSSLAGEVLASVWLAPSQGVLELRTQLAKVLDQAPSSLLLLDGISVLTDDLVNWPFFRDRDNTLIIQ